MEQITLTEAIKRYASVLTLEQIIVLRQFHREFTTAIVNVEPVTLPKDGAEYIRKIGESGLETIASNKDKLTIELIIA